MNAHHSSSAELFKWLTAMFVELLLLLPGQCRRRRRLSTGQGRRNEDSNEIAHSESVHITPSYVHSFVRPVLCNIRDAIDGTDDDDDEQEESI